jgi:hypothetical protein
VAPPDAARDIRVLRRIDGKSDVFEIGAPAVPLVAENGIGGQGRPASFDDRFGGWTSVSPVGPQIGPQPDNAIDPRNIRVLRRVAP